MSWIGAFFFPVVWVAYLVCWQAMASGVKAAKSMEPATSRTVRAVLFLSGAALLCLPDIPVPLLYFRFFPASNWLFFTGATIATIGLLFSVWARRHLGSNWSRAVTIKQDHELITTGPYALVRHPIYTGLLTGFIGTVIAMSQLRGLIGFALIFSALLYKLRLEEKWMRLEFGNVYQGYARRVPALIPWIL